MKKKLRNLLFLIYVVIAVFVTICLLSYNQMKTTEFGNYTLVIVDSDELGEGYKKGDLLIVDGGEKIITGRKAFFYTTSNREIKISLAKVKGIEKVTDTESTYTLEGDHQISSEYIIGTEEAVTQIPVVGTILEILESKWGFLFLIVLPALLMFLYQITVVFAELKGKEDEK